MVLSFKFRRRRRDEPAEGDSEAVDLGTLPSPTSPTSPTDTMSPPGSNNATETTHNDVGGSGGSGGSGTSASASAAGTDATFTRLRRFEKMHHLDPNLPVKDMRDVDAVLASGNAEKGIEIEQVLVEEDSPYIEVRSAVRNYDIDVPANTIRAWTIGMVLCTIGSGINVLFSLRSPGVAITAFVIQLVAYPIGLLWDLVLPDHQFDLWGVKFNFRPGRFNYKEHVVIVIMSNAAYGGGAMYATDIIVAHQKYFMQEPLSKLWQVLFGVTTLCTGFGLAGLARRFLVWPAAMIWPTNLANTVLFYAMHDHRHDHDDDSDDSDDDDHAPSPSDEDPTAARRRRRRTTTTTGIGGVGVGVGSVSGWWRRIGRKRWFLIVFGAMFAWYWFPGWIFQGLTWFCWITWIWPDSVIVNKLFGGYSGYGLMPVTLDWTIVSGYLQSPLIPPFHAIANTIAGVFVFFIVVSMGLHFSGHWFAEYLPVQSAEPYDNTAQPYEFPYVLDPQTFLFDESAYRSYSPIYFSTQGALGFGLAFAAVAAVIVHVALYHGPQLWAQLRRGRDRGTCRGRGRGRGGGRDRDRDRRAQEEGEQQHDDVDDDVHMRLMRKYRDAEDWWYAALLVVMVALSLVVVCAWPATGLPWWAYVVCMLIPLAWTVPIGIVQAMTNVQLGVSVLAEYVYGYMLPGGQRPLAGMVFKAYAHLTMSQALFFAQDMKLGHYMKVPPRTMFWAQLVAAVWSAVVQIVVLNAALESIPGVCEAHQQDKFSCDGARATFNSAVMWGGIGPARMFGGESIYAGLQWFWLVGAAAPVVTWLFARHWPRSFWRYISMPVFFGGATWIPPATVYMYLCWALVGTAFNFYIKRRFSGWWTRYNYITSAGLDCGVVVGNIVIFFALYLTKANSLMWFGNSEALGTLDLKLKAIKQAIPYGDIFGPTEWS